MDLSTEEIANKYGLAACWPNVDAALKEYGAQEAKSYASWLGNQVLAGRTAHKLWLDYEADVLSNVPAAPALLRSWANDAAAMMPSVDGFVQVGWCSPFGLVPGGMDNEPAANWQPIYIKAPNAPAPAVEYAILRDTKEGNAHDSPEAGRADENPLLVVGEVLDDWLAEIGICEQPTDDLEVASLFAMLGTAGYSIVPNHMVAAAPSIVPIEGGAAGTGWRTGLPDDNEKYWVLVRKQRSGRLKVKRSCLTPAKNGFYVKYDKQGNAPIEEVIGWQPIVGINIPVV